MGDEKQCRICWGTAEEDKKAEVEGDEPDINPLITPCKCCGSMKLIHLKCLRNWLN
jgi:E3 ubiquitin-protein ligase DOA10